MDHLGLQDSPLAEGALRTRLAQLQRRGSHRAAAGLAERRRAAQERRWPARAVAATTAQLLLLDEPTNHTDLASSLAIETAGGFPRRDAEWYRTTKTPPAPARRTAEPAGGRLAASGTVTRKGGPRGLPFISGR